MIILSQIRRLRNILRDIKEQKYHSIWQIRRGFHNDTVLIDAINKENREEFISDKEYVNGHPYNGAYTGIIDNKLYLPMLLHNWKQYLPKTFYFKDLNGLLPIDVKESEILNRGGHFVAHQNIESIIPLLAAQGKLVLKHTHSSIGEGFHLLEHIDGNFFIDRKNASEKEIIDFVSTINEYLVQEYVSQAKYSSEIYSNSVNTMRFQCVWDYEKDTFFVARSFHRFGCNGQLVDNVGAGNGILIYIDPETGKTLNEGVIKHNGKKEYFLNNGDCLHPDSKIKLNDMAIPGYEEIKRQIIRISNENAFLKWIGWDVVATYDGFKIIEANSLTTLETIQQRQGFFKDPRIKRILRR